MAKNTTLNKQSYFRISIVVLLVTLLLTACAPTPPSESDAKTFIATKGEERSLYKVNSFTKTNGQSMNNGNIYIMEYEVEVECLKSTSNMISGIGSFTPSCEYEGEAVNERGKLVFEKLEKGWRVNELMSMDINASW